MFGLGLPEVVVLSVIALLIFGPKKLQGCFIINFFKCQILALAGILSIFPSSEIFSQEKMVNDRI